MRIRVPRKPSNEMWSQAVFHSPMSATYSISDRQLDRRNRGSPRARAASSRACCGAVGVGERRPRRRRRGGCSPVHERTRSARLTKTGARAVFDSVSPVLPSLPAYGTPRARASSYRAGDVRPERGREVDERAARVERGVGVETGRGEDGLPAAERVLERRRLSCAGSGAAKASVEETLTTTTRESPFRSRNASRSPWRPRDELERRPAELVRRDARPKIFLAFPRGRPATACGSQDGITPACARACARSESRVSARSWPPKTRSEIAGRPTAAKGGNSVTSPVGWTRPALSAPAPAIVVVATEPRPPISHSPVFSEEGMGRRRSLCGGALDVCR